MDYKEFFRGKKITVMGVDAAGRGLKDARFLVSCGAEVIATDMKMEKDLPEIVALAKEYPDNLTLALGGHRLEDFVNRDYVIRAALAPKESPFLAHARASGVPVVSDETLFLSLAPGIKTIGVTGTRGKTTVTYLIYEILKAALLAGGQADKRAHLGGNIQGTALLPLLAEVAAGDYVVMELDSWKLQSFAEAGISPQVAVFTTFFPDHLNYYKGNMDLYFADKAAVYKNQKAGDVLIIGSSVADEFARRGETRRPDAIVSVANLPAKWKLKMLGEHNRLNAALALSVARSLGISDSISRTALLGFAGVPGRLEYLGEKNGIKFYNDTTATTPDGTIAAFLALSDYAGKIVWLGGGADKNLEYAEFGKVAPRYLKSAILFRGAATDKIRKELGALPVIVGKDMESMDEAFAEAMSHARPGDVVLLSPAAASFGVFKNEYDRGDRFVKCLNSL